MLLLLYDCCLANLITSSNHIFLWQHRTIPALRLKHRSGSCGTASALPKMLDNVGLRYPHRASGAKAPPTLRPLPLLRFAVSATGGAHLCSIQFYLRFWLGICRTSLAVSALRIMRYCPYRNDKVGNPAGKRCGRAGTLQAKENSDKNYFIQRICCSFTSG